MLWLLTLFIALIYLSNYHFKHKVLLILLTCEFIYLFSINIEFKIKSILVLAQIINLTLFTIIFKILVASKESPTLNLSKNKSSSIKREQINILRNMYYKRYQKLLKYRIIREDSINHYTYLSLSFLGKILRATIGIMDKVFNLQGKVG